MKLERVKALGPTGNFKILMALFDKLCIGLKISNKFQYVIASIALSRTILAERYYVTFSL